MAFFAPQVACQPPKPHLQVLAAVVNDCVLEDRSKRSHGGRRACQRHAAVPTARVDFLCSKHDSVSAGPLEQLAVFRLEHQTGAVCFRRGRQAEGVEPWQLLWEAQLVRLEVELQTVCLGLLDQLGDQLAESSAALSMWVPNWPDFAAVPQVLVIDIILDIRMK